MCSQSMGRGDEDLVAAAQSFQGFVIRFVALHFRGKTYAWWIFDSCSLKDANTSSYFRFIGTMMKDLVGENMKHMQRNKPRLCM